jgi:hypothetical protein
MIVAVWPKVTMKYMSDRKRDEPFVLGELNMYAKREGGQQQPRNKTRRNTRFFC